MRSSERVLLVAGTIAVLLPFGLATADAAPISTRVPSEVSAPATALDRVIDLMVQLRVTTENLSSADARIAREQLQFEFLSLSTAEQQSLLAVAQNVNDQKGAADVMKALNDAITTSARDALATAQGRQQGMPITTQGARAKLGLASADLIFVATVGPCRVTDSRNIPAQLPAGTARQIWAWSDFSGYSWSSDQGGTGTAGAGNCAGTVYPDAASPVSAVAIVTVVNTSSSGALQAWDGGTTLSGGAVVNWNAGDRLTNTTVIPVDRFIPAYPGSGSKRDFALNNNSGAPIDYVVDVIGYFIPNTATALDCTIVSSATVSVPANAWTPIDASCPAGYSATGGGFNTTEGTLGYPGVWTTNLPVSSTTWRTWVDNQTGGNRNIYTSVQCCRVPGR